MPGFEATPKRVPKISMQIRHALSYYGDDVVVLELITVCAIKCVSRMPPSIISRPHVACS